MSSRSPASLLKLSADIASFYGFKSLRELEHQGIKIDRSRGPFAAAAGLCSNLLLTHPLEPVLAWSTSALPSHLPQDLSPREAGEFSLFVVGSPESLGEVVILKTLSTIATEWGSRVVRVRINALGDRDSRARFGRELLVYLRKRTNELDESCRRQIQANPLSAHWCESPTCRMIAAEGPRAMNFLSEKSRAHFREVLEHLEHLSLPYELDDSLVGDEREPHIAFALELEVEDGTILGSLGGRYDEYVRRLCGRKEGSTVSASLYFRKRGASRAHFALPGPTRAPKVYFVQLGLRAKLRGLSVIDMLREARMPVSQSFDSSHLGTQLISAQSLGVAHLLIMGQREALDGTVIVRSTKNSSQTIVELSHLPRFLKTLR